MNTKQLARLFAVIVCIVAVFSTLALTWTRKDNRPVRARDGINIERVATEWRVVDIGKRSVFVPSDEGGDGQRFMADIWALQVRAANGVWADLEWAWGDDALVVAYLSTKKRAHQANADSEMFLRFGYTPYAPFDATVMAIP